MACGTRCASLHSTLVSGTSPHSQTLLPALCPSHLAAVDFFNHLNMLYGTVTEFCTPQEVGTSGPYSIQYMEVTRTSV